MLGSLWSWMVDTAAGWSLAGVFLRLLLATIVGVVVGLDREYHNKGAGVKTHVLVCIASALSMIVSEYVLVHFPDATADMNRIPAGIVGGMGFIGAGTIIMRGRSETRGLTTAAGLWVCLGMSLAAGIGYVEGTLLALAFVVFTFTVLGRLDRHLRRFSRSFDLYVEFESRGDVREFLRMLHGMDCDYSDFELHRDESGKRGGAATLTVHLTEMGRKAEFIEEVQSLDFVSYCDEL